MTSIFETDQIFRISKSTSLRYPSIHPFEQFHQASQPKDQDFQEIKSMLQSTCSLVETLRTENSLIRYENKNIKETLFQYIKAISEENRDLRKEMKEMSRNIESGNNELLCKIEEKMRKLEVFERKKKQMLLQSNHQIFHYEPDKKTEKKLSFERSQQIDEKKPRHKKIMSSVNFAIFDRKNEELKKKEEVSEGITKTFQQNLDYESLFNANQSDAMNFFMNVDKNPLTHREMIDTNFFDEKHDKIAKIDDIQIQDIMVYGTYTGSCYHKQHCSYLRSSCVPTLLSEAKIKWRACSRCCPP